MDIQMYVWLEIHLFSLLPTVMLFMNDSMNIYLCCLNSTDVCAVLCVCVLYAVLCYAMLCCMSCTMLYVLCTVYVYRGIQ